MIFEKTPVTGVHVIRLEARQDDRGLFARVFCESEFAAQGLETKYVQSNLSMSRQRGTLRGMHYQIGTAAEVKVVRCTSGALYDVALDLRPDSPTFGRSFGLELSADNRTTLYIPRGCAHGFITLTDNAEVTYLVSAPYSPQQERGVRYNDPRFSIAWPIAPVAISPKDAQWPDFEPVFHGSEELRGFIKADSAR
jgi:dTDP-4-dehydrorhamnose 3,5-epimerase